jgi:hypothetical protein
MSSHTEPILERLKKIQALAESGIAGERENAQRMLAELQAKYGITLEQLASAEKRFYTFKHRTKLEARLLIQILLSICRTRKIRHIVHASKTEVELTAAQAVDIQDAYHHYRKELNTAVNDLFAALCCKHKLLLAEKEEDKESTPEDIAQAKRVYDLMLGMNTNHWNKRLRLTA